MGKGGIEERIEMVPFRVHYFGRENIKKGWRVVIYSRRSFSSNLDLASCYGAKNIGSNKSIQMSNNMTGIIFFLDWLIYKLFWVYHNDKEVVQKWLMACSGFFSEQFWTKKRIDKWTFAYIKRVQNKSKTS